MMDYAIKILKARIEFENYELDAAVALGDKTLELRYLNQIKDLKQALKVLEIKNKNAKF